MGEAFGIASLVATAYFGGLWLYIITRKGRR